MPLIAFPRQSIGSVHVSVGFTIASICLLVGGAEILATCRRIFGKVDCYMTDIHIFLIGELQNETITVAEMRILRKV